MTNNKSSTKRAALELIEAEKQRRIAAKMASGEAVQGPPLILVRGVKDGSASVEKETVVERDEDGREVLRIVTGVPRRGRDDGDVAATAQPREEVNDKT